MANGYNALVRVVVVAVSVGCVSSCTALVVGGAGAGGSAAGQAERPATRIIDDRTITASVKSRLAADTYVSGFDITVATERGAVKLTGTVPSSVARDQAMRIARRVDGVSSVVDNITVNSKSN